jgi:hypothetical protein
MLRAAMRASAIVVAMAAAVASNAMAAECKAVRGYYVETAVPTPPCASPVGLCTAAQLSGSVKGDAFFTASSIIPTADTATTGVVFVTGDTTVSNAKFGERQGTLFIKNAAAFRSIGAGDLTDTQVIVGGSGGFAGTTGSLRVVGTFDGLMGTGTMTFEGSICFP